MIYITDSTNQREEKIKALEKKISGVLKLVGLNMDLFTGGFSSEVEDILLLNKRSKWVGGVVTKFFFFHSLDFQVKMPD